MFDSVGFFKRCTEESKLAKSLGFGFARVSGLESFEDALKSLTIYPALVCATDSSDGYLQFSNSPHERRVHTVFLAMRHAEGDMEARQRCLDTLRVLFRQFVSRIIRERDRIELGCQAIDEKITFQEVDRWFFPGCACAYFNIAVTEWESIFFDERQWEIQEDNN